MPKPTIKVNCFYYKCIAIASVIYYNPQSILVVLPINIEVLEVIDFWVELLSFHQCDPNLVLVKTLILIEFNLIQALLTVNSSNLTLHQIFLLHGK